MGFGNLAKMAQQMQAEMARVQAELDVLTVEGSAGGGAVRAIVTGKQELLSVAIDPEVVDPDDVEMLQDLVMAAVNDALSARQVRGRATHGGRDRRPAAARAWGEPPLSQLVEPVARLIEAFSRLPGIGPKTAQRLTYHLLRAPDTEARSLAAALIAVRDEVVFCEVCFNIGSGPALPDLPRRAPRPGPAARRRGAARRPGARADRRRARPLPRAPGRHLADRRHRPRAAAHPRAAGAGRGRAAAGEPFDEVILATNPTLEGEATAMYIAERITPHVGAVTRIARGIPVGGDLEYADEVTLVRALQGRRAMETVEP